MWPLCSTNFPFMFEVQLSHSFCQPIVSDVLYQVNEIIQQKQSVCCLPRLTGDDFKHVEELLVSSISICNNGNGNSTCIVNKEPFWTRNLGHRTDILSWFQAVRSHVHLHCCELFQTTDHRDTIMNALHIFHQQEWCTAFDHLPICWTDSRYKFDQTNYWLLKSYFVMFY